MSFYFAINFGEASLQKMPKGISISEVLPFIISGFTFLGGLLFLILIFLHIASTKKQLPFALFCIIFAIKIFLNGFFEQMHMDFLTPLLLMLITLNLLQLIKTSKTKFFTLTISLAGLAYYILLIFSQDRPILLQLMILFIFFSFAGVFFKQYQQWALAIRIEAFFWQLILIGLFIDMFYYSYYQNKILTVAPFLITYIVIRFISLLKVLKSEKPLNQISNNCPALASHLKAHFLFNALSAIYYTVGQDVKGGRSLILDFSDYLRGVFEYQGPKDQIKLDFELQHLKAYLNLEQARFGSKLNIDFSVEASLEQLVPRLSIQSLAENAVKNGIAPQQGGGTVWVKSWEDKEFVYFEVADDGVGMSAEQLDAIWKNEAKNNNIVALNQRLQILYKQELQIDSILGQGTKVSFAVPKA